MISYTTHQSIYHPLKENQWTGINWSKVEQTVENLQHRITKAMEQKNYRKVRNLQRLLTKSFAARSKAVRQVAQENSGKKTPGIDGEVWTTPNHKIQAVQELRKRSKTKPLKRVYIPKSNDTQRPLGIPCISDRAKQALWNLALLPCVEATSDLRSYGFRPHRGCWDANAQIRTSLDKHRSPEWILDADIEKCFDKINHNWLLENAPMEKYVLKSWLKAGYLEGKKLFPTNEGTPQGGVISPTLANLTLNGMENHLKKKFKNNKSIVTPTGQRSKVSNCINLIRYADDFIVTGRSKRQLERVRLELNNFLAERGLRISEEKTSICHIYVGFDLLGWTFRKYPTGALLVTISRKSISRHKKEIKYLTKNNQCPKILIAKLNDKIRGWMNYHRCCNGIWDVWKEMRKYTFTCLMKWGMRRHGQKTRKWIYNRYWQRIGNCMTFTDGIDKVGKKPTSKLLQYGQNHTKIRVRIKNTINVFDLQNKNYLRKLQSIKKIQLSHVKAKIWKRQQGFCLNCGQYLDWKQPSTIDLHHIIPKSMGGTNKLSNLMLLHEHCHYESHYGKLLQSKRRKNK